MPELDIQMFTSPPAVDNSFVLLAALAEKRDFVCLLKAGLMFAASGVLYLFGQNVAVDGGQCFARHWFGVIIRCPPVWFHVISRGISGEAVCLQFLPSPM